MKKAIQHSIIYLLTAMVLVSSTGFSVHYLYCYCKGDTATSLLPPADPCDLAENQKTACCKKRACGFSDQLLEHRCSDCSFKYVKLDVDYVLNAFHFELKTPVISISLFELEPIAQTIIEKAAIAWEQDIPPPYGKELLPLIQSFLC